MTTPYRNEIEALRERKGSLERELSRLKQETEALEGMRAREEELQRELAAVAARLGAEARPRKLPMLDDVQVASPCSASWDEMLGDERVRFCLSCEKNVYNLSAMPREEAERLLEERSADKAGDLCVRFYRRADGTIMTVDCPVGVKRKRRKKLALAVAGAGAMAFAAVSAMRSQCTTTQGSPVMMGEVAMGGMGVEPPATHERLPPPPPTSRPETIKELRPVMGAVPPPATSAPPVHPKVVMGRRAAPGK